VRSGVKFLLEGDHWWAFLTILSVLLCPVAQFAYMAWKHGVQVAWPYLLPFSVKHTMLEVRTARFLNRLPQSAFDDGLPEDLSAGCLSKVLAGMECGFESFPQAVVQSRAFYVKGGDLLNVASIAFSFASTIYGMCLGVSALLNKKTAWREYSWQEIQDLDFSSGKAISFGGKDLTEQATQEALLWFMSEDELISEVDLGNATFTDSFVPALAGNCRNLSRLGLDNTQVTDAAIKELAGNRRNLSVLVLRNTQVTDAAVMEFHKLVPSCGVFHRW